MFHTYLPIHGGKNHAANHYDASIVEVVFGDPINWVNFLGEEKDHRSD